ncbi:MAG: hypothetical protein ACFFB5_18870 [Promethearchaeota archaeon]
MNKVTDQQPLTPEKERITLNSINTLRTGFFYFKTYPHLFLICLVAICIDWVLILFGLVPTSVFDLFAFLLWNSIPAPVDNSSTILLGIPILWLNIVFTIIFGTFIHCWYYSCLKQIRRNGVETYLVSSLNDSLRFLPRAVVAETIAIGIILIVGMSIYFSSALIGWEIIASIFPQYESTEMPINPAAIMLYAFLIPVIFGVFIIGLFFFVLFTYVRMSIVFDNIPGFGLNRSQKFARKYLATTTGLILLFIAVLYLIIGGFFRMFSPSLQTFTPLVISLFFSVIFRLVEAYKAVGLGWAYDEFKHEIS